MIRTAGVFLAIFAWEKIFASPDTLKLNDTLRYVDCSELAIIGKAHDEPGYYRFPEKYRNVVRKEVWELSRQSAGIAIRFRSNASTMFIRWKLLSGEPFPHMAWTGIGGLDLYTYKEGKWVFVQTGRPSGKENEYLMFENKNPDEREYLLNLPLYDGIDSLFVGVNRAAVVSKPRETALLRNKPIVYYGSSIAQGGCAARPGMAFTGILSRWLDRPVINFGFSGEGTFDESVGQVMCETDPALYVIDCNPNSQPEIIYERAVKLVEQLKKCRPGTPVLFVENFIYTDDAALPENTFIRLKPGSKPGHVKWVELRKAYEYLIGKGVTKLYYHKSDKMIGDDGEGTVDGSHPTDLGMWRIAKDLLPDIKKIIAAPR